MKRANVSFTAWRPGRLVPGLSHESTTESPATLPSSITSGSADIRRSMSTP